MRKLKRILIPVLAVAVVAGTYTGTRVLGGNLRSEHGYPVSAPANWGLSFQQEGQVPIGNASVSELSRYKAYYCADARKKEIYLTFDAGFENGCTEQILDVLKKEKVPAAFFLVGTYIEKNPELVKRMVKEGHIVGNHTWSHPDMSAISDKDSFSQELKRVEDIYRTVTGNEMKKYYRPPQGKFSFDNLAMARGLGYTTVFWSLAYVDWLEDAQPSREEALEKLLPRTHNGAIILLHSTSKTNAAVLDELIQNWKSEGYKFKSVTELKPLS